MVVERKTSSRLIWAQKAGYDAIPFEELPFWIRFEGRKGKNSVAQEPRTPRLYPHTNGIFIRKQEEA